MQFCGKIVEGDKKPHKGNTTKVQNHKDSDFKNKSKLLKNKEEERRFTMGSCISQCF